MGHKLLKLMFIPVFALSAVACDQLQKPASVEPAATGETVATVNGQELKESDLRQVYDSLPPEAQQLPFDFLQAQLVPALVNRTLLLQAAEKAGYADNDKVREQLAMAEKEFMRDTWVLDEIERRTTDERLRPIYDALVGGEDGEAVERHARHILVEDEALALDLIAQLDAGGDFVALANEHSIDTGSVDGDLGFFGRGMMVEPFENAAFDQEIGTWSAAPVQSQFGYHIILVEAERAIEPPSFAEMRDELARDEMRSIYDEIIDELRAGADIVMPDDGIEESEIDALPAE